MFRHEELKEHLKRQPFQPLRLRVSTGNEYVIRHPDLLWVGNRTMHIGIPKESRPDDSVFDRWVEVALIHLVEVEPLPLPPGRKAKTNGKKD